MSFLTELIRIEALVAENGEAEVVTADDHALFLKLLQDEQTDFNEVDGNSRNALHVAVAIGNETLLKEILKTNKIDVNQKEASKRTPLALAVELKRTESFLRILLSNKAEANFRVKEEHIILFFTKQANVDLCELFLEFDADPNGGVALDKPEQYKNLPVKVALDKSNKKLVELLMGYGAHANNEHGLTIFKLLGKTRTDYTKQTMDRHIKKQEKLTKQSETVTEHQDKVIAQQQSNQEATQLFEKGQQQLQSQFTLLLSQFRNLLMDRRHVSKLRQTKGDDYVDKLLLQLNIPVTQVEWKGLVKRYDDNEIKLQSLTTRLTALLQLQPTEEPGINEVDAPANFSPS